MNPDVQSTARVDAIIVGGGIAGLWTLNVLRHNGYSALLFEAEALGCGQTLASQGMIHGGLKYALGGQMTRASEAIADMPSRWRACLAGQGQVDLAGLTPLAEHYYMFAARGALGRLTTFFASKGLRGRIEKLHRAAYPEVFRFDEFQGSVYQLNDFVLDTTALIERLERQAQQSIYRLRVDARQCAVANDSVSLTIGAQTLSARRLILCAGTGNATLARALAIDATPMQTRPLHQVIVRHENAMPAYAHCLTALTRAEPRLTVTSHRDGAGWLWYLGGQLATDGVELDRQTQCDAARTALVSCFPWLDWSDASFTSLMIDRAEPVQTGGTRPDQAFVEANGPCITCWPTKLALAPDLGDQVLALLPPPEHVEPLALDLPPPPTGDPAWVRG